MTAEQEAEPNPKNLVVKSFTIVPAQAKVLDDLSQALGRSESDLIREAIVLLWGMYKDAAAK